MSRTKIFLTNILVLFGLVVLLELLWSAFGKTLLDPVQCEPGWVLYNYCPNIKTTNLNHVNDGGQLISIEVDDLGGRVQPGSNSTFENARRFMIGDSFIQADEMLYSDTIYGRWNNLEENSTYALGYSSWNPIQYFDAIKRIGKTNSHYYVFLMINDVLPKYPRSVYGEISNNQKTYLPFFFRNMLSYKALGLIKSMVIQSIESNYSSSTQSPEITSNLFSPKYIHDCSALNEIKDSSYSRKIGFDHLVFSKTYECWPEIHRIAFNEFLSIIKKIENYVVIDLESKVTFVWVGAGWSHKNQNSIGRISPEYSFSNQIAITQQGLINEFKVRLPKVEVIDTEQLINTNLSSCFGSCIDKYFYSFDGHWTPETHNLVFYTLK